MIYRQRPIKGGRYSVPAYLEERIEKVLEREADRFNVTRAFVITTALADYFGIDVEEVYRDTRKRNFRQKNRSMIDGKNHTNGTHEPRARRSGDASQATA